MKIYVATVGWNYEGIDILGVYSSEANALEKIEEAKKEGTFDFFEVKEYDLDDLHSQSRASHE